MRHSHQATKPEKLDAEDLRDAGAAADRGELADACGTRTAASARRGCAATMFRATTFPWRMRVLRGRRMERRRCARSGTSAQSPSAQTPGQPGDPQVLVDADAAALRAARQRVEERVRRACRPSRRACARRSSCRRRASRRRSVTAGDLRRGADLDAALGELPLRVAAERSDELRQDDLARGARGPCGPVRA